MRLRIDMAGKLFLDVVIGLGLGFGIAIAG
ncbi:hypothetical protein X768_18555 [Mesorhizobium sp. LSJC265A00]|nr:hypothetical protein X768_18555 [Mesorhizobium sp. LSJC265A00]